MFDSSYLLPPSTTLRSPAELLIIDALKNLPLFCQSNIGVPTSAHVKSHFLGKFLLLIRSLGMKTIRLRCLVMSIRR